MHVSEFNRRSTGSAFACTVGTMLASGTTIIGTFSVFMLPILAEFGWGRAKISGVMMTMSCTSALLSPLVGRLLDRWGVRRVVLPGFLLFALAVMGLSRASENVVLFYLAFLTVGVPAALISIVPYVKVVSAWFNHRRGLVLALVGVGATLCGSQMPPLARWLIDGHGWRGAYLIMGVAILLIGLPILWALLHEPARRTERTAQASDPLQQGMSAAQIRRDPTYWLLIAILFLSTFAVGGTLGHMVPLMVDRGLTPAQAALALSIFPLGSVIGRLGMGFLLDHFRTPRVALPFFAAAMLGLLLLQSGESLGQFVAAGALLGLCLGAEGESAPYLHSRYFGLKAFAETFGLKFMFLAIGNGVGILAMGAAHDLFGDYRPLLWVFLGLFVLTLIFLLLLGPYRFDPRQPNTLPQAEPEATTA